MHKFTFLLLFIIQSILNFTQKDSVIKDNYKEPSNKKILRLKRNGHLLKKKTNSLVEKDALPTDR